MVDLGEAKQTVAVAALAGLAGLLVGANLDKVVTASRPVTEWIGQTTGEAFGELLKFALRQKEAVEDTIAAARMRGVKATD